MAYIDGFVIAVPTANKQKFIDHANLGDSAFVERGATRVVECWEDDVPEGKVTDFRRAVNAEDGEAIVFSWIEWPDKAKRDAAMQWMMSEEGMADPRMNQEKNPMPFDAKRMIFGGFAPIVDQSETGDNGYTDGYVLPVAEGKKAAYLAMAEKAAPIFREYGATRVVEAWGDDVPDGKVTDFKRAVKAEGENVVFSYVEWPDKATRDAAWAKIMEDERMKPEGEMPFDGQRMFWGGFTPVVTL